MEVNLTIPPPRRVVVKISGHLINPDNIGSVLRYGECLRKLREKGLALAVVVGGGVYARKYISAARSVGASESLCDILGVHITRANALLLISAIGLEHAYPEPPRGVEVFLKASATGKIVVIGGFEPGQSTAAVAALVAEAFGANALLLATRVEGVYDKDPRVHRDAKLLKEVTVTQLREILSKTQSMKAGGYELLDPLALAIIERSKIPVIVFNGSKPELLEKIVVEGRNPGTLVKHE